MKRVAIQGIKGSFHDIAAHRFFGEEEVELLCCNSFDEVFKEMKKDASTLGLVAIENTIAGSLLHNYELLRESGMTIIGEQRLHIEHSILCLPDEDWGDIKEVNSHPIALAQCRNFLSRHPEMKVVEAEDTASAAKKINDKQLKGHAAICSKYVAPLYGMKVLEEGIEDNKHNFTRFLALCDTWRAEELRDVRKSNKSSIVFAIPHEQGKLSQVLSILSFYRINMTKIQSLPIIGREWEYMFYVDVTYDDYTRYCQSMDAIKPLTKALKCLGEYAEN